MNTTTDPECKPLNDGTIQRYAYKNTCNSKGKAILHLIKLDEIRYIMSWTNIWGNPSYVFHMLNGDTYYMVDSYSAMNNVNRKIHFVSRKKDMF